MNDPEAFWRHVAKGDGCWEWTGRRLRQRRDYGQIQWDGRTQVAHRIAYMLTNGSIAPGLSVLHRCDNPPCCRPDHLFLGTQLDNWLDCTSKGRPSSVKLNADQVRVIRRSVAQGRSRASLSREMGVTLATIRQVVRGITWRHVGGSD